MPWRRQPAHCAELLAHWQSLGQALHRDNPAWRAEGRRLILAWARWPRAYHDTSHLWACLRHWQTVQDQEPSALDNPHAVALALWYHDAIYWPWSRHNEERSADWASRFMLSQDLPHTLAQTVHQHILDTRHTPGPLIGDARWVVDIDLAILGQTDAVYRQFERNVRREYFFVRWPRYVAGRSAVLRGFLDQPRIYGSDWFFDRCEAQARINLGSALAALAEGRLHQ
ncbi:HD domain-containing protein [Acidovorax sp. BL-A-41-H1]|uniref:HD domain-containing protein n=1 Tax=Acidovorax sp. BL-A-41-H1 TaxID=3421102 RepID=UPI003F79E278